MRPIEPGRDSSIQHGPGQGEVTRLLREARDGNGGALDRALSLIYDDLRTLARRQLRREYQERTLEPTALVHEAYLKMVRGITVDAVDRAHLLSLAAHAMRQVLVDHARRRIAAKRQDAWKQVTLTDAGATSGLDADELLALDDALEKLDARQRRIVESRFFGGMNDGEIALALGVTDRTVRREWVKARARLNHALYGPA
jgi:RNA polymerase sigma factor (TIGR02999 family)